MMKTCNETIYDSDAPPPAPPKPREQRKRKALPQQLSLPSNHRLKVLKKQLSVLL